MDLQSIARLASAALVFAFLAGCRNSSGPEDGCELPPPDASLDPAALRIGAAIFACGRWGEGGKPSEAEVTVDIFFGRRGPEAPPDRPVAEHLSSITDRGGTVCHEFNFPAARARMDKDRIPELDADWPDASVHEVPDLRRYDWIVIVGYRRPLEEADSVRFVALGGRVEYRLEFIDAIAGPLPDRSIPELRSLEDVEYVEAAGLLCVAGTAR